jgi:hypothetical protein
MKNSILNSEKLSKSNYDSIAKKKKIGKLSIIKENKIFVRKNQPLK